MDTQLGGNIGTAILTLEPPAAGRVHVIECSSYQIDLAPSLDPTAGILLNITPDHIDRHGSLEHYASVKERLVAKSDVAIVGIDDEPSAEIADRIAANGTTVLRLSRHASIETGFFATGSRIDLVEGGVATPFVDLTGIQTLRGSHNAQNAAAAIAAVRAVGVSDSDIRAGLTSFPGLKHRMQPVGRLGEVVFVNDSKATNAEAAAPALSSYDRIYWIAGGRAKEGGITSLAPFFDRIAKAYLIGEAAESFAETLSGKVAVERSGTLELAVAAAARDAGADGVTAAVLLSPACASFDQYKNFEVRGDAFVSLVAGLPGVTMLI